jgi:hypothetical protein
VEKGDAVVMTETFSVVSVVHIDVDIDNASAHTARVTQNFFRDNRLKRLRHPPYSPDISPSDFYLLSFRKVKNALIAREVSDEIDLLEVVTEILSGISYDELHADFRSPAGLSVYRP